MGKIDRDFFQREIEPRLGASRHDIVLGPEPGVDFAVLDVNDSAFIVSTEPTPVLPGLGFERAGKYAIRRVLGDVAVSGIGPSHLTISLALPPSFTEDEFAHLWEAIDAQCRDMDVSIVSGHTGWYEGCEFPWIGSANAMAVGDHDDVIRPGDVRPGDDILVTNGPAIEAAGLLATLFPEQLPIDSERLTAAQGLLNETDTVRDALTVADAGGDHVSAIHNPREGGILRSFHEMAATAGVQFIIDRSAVPVQPGVTVICDVLDIDPWTATTAGTLVITVDPEVTDDVVASLEQWGTTVSVVGTVERGAGVLVDGSPVESPESNSFWDIYEKLSSDTPMTSKREERAQRSSGPYRRGKSTYEEEQSSDSQRRQSSPRSSPADQSSRSSSEADPSQSSSPAERASKRASNAQDTETAAAGAASTVADLYNPETLLDRDDIESKDVKRVFDRDRFESLRERYADIAGIAQVGLTIDQGYVLLQGFDGATNWAPPTAEVEPGRNWVDTTQNNLERLIGVDIQIDDIILVEDLTFCVEDDEQTCFSSFGVSFTASLVGDNPEFIRNPTLADDLNLPDEYDWTFEWFDSVPADANPNHIGHIERFLEHA